MKWLVRIGLLLTAILVATWLWLRPVSLRDQSRHAVAYVNGWNVTITYQTGAREALITVRMDGLGRYDRLAYRITSAQEWAPHWQAEMTGRLSEYLTLNDGWSVAPTPMTADLAEEIARSYKVVALLGDEERIFDFSYARVEHTTAPPVTVGQQRGASCDTPPYQQID